MARRAYPVAPPIGPFHRRYTGISSSVRSRWPRPARSSRRSGRVRRGCGRGGHHCGGDGGIGSSEPRAMNSAWTRDWMLGWSEPSAPGRAFRYSGVLRDGVVKVRGPALAIVIVLLPTQSLDRGRDRSTGDDVGTRLGLVLGAFEGANELHISGEVLGVAVDRGRLGFPEVVGRFARRCPRMSTSLLLPRPRRGRRRRPSERTERAARRRPPRLSMPTECSWHRHP